MVVGSNSTKICNLIPKESHYHKKIKDCGKKQKKRSYEGRQENGCDRDLFENNKQKREIQRRGESIGVKSKCNRRGTK